MAVPVSARKILLVEDEAIIALAEARVLKDAGFDVEIVHRGQDAVDRASASPDIDLVLMDIDLGKGIDGTEAASKILEIRNLPILFLTGHAEKEMVDRVKGITRYGYVLKGGGNFVLVESVTMALELYAAHQKTLERELRIERLNRTYAVLSDVNKAIVRIRRTDLLLAEVCRVAVESGGFLFAWVGIHDPETNLLNPVAWYGNDDTYVSSIVIDFNDPSLAGGPAGRAFRTGLHYVANRIATDPEMAPWRTEALSRGFRASAALPIRVFSRSRGVFSFYAGEEDFFDEEEVRLLDELATDIGAAMEIEREASHRAGGFNDEQALVFREAGHRMKNNMQMMSSLLRVEAAEVADQRLADGLGIASERLDSMSRLFGVIHGAFTSEPRLDLTSVIRKLGETLQTTVVSHQVHIIVEGAECHMDGKVAVPVVLVVNEAVTNAVRHAFAGVEGTHELRISVVHQDAENRIVVRVVDDGVGFPQAVLQGSTEGAGLTIMKALASQVNGALTLSNRPDSGGAELRLTFPAPDQREA